RRLDEAVAALDGSSKVSPAIFINYAPTPIPLKWVARYTGGLIWLPRKTDLGVETMLVGMYSKCGFLKESRQVFEGMRERDLHASSAMIGGCLREQRWKEVVELFYGMIGEGVLPHDFLLPKILQACGNCGDVQTGRLLLHGLAVQCGFESGSFVGNSIMSLYAKFGELGLARKCFESMEERDTVAWTAMISGCFLNRNFEEGFRLFDAMYEQASSQACCETGSFDVAMKVMNTMRSCGVKTDSLTWTTMISGFAKNDREEQALDLFKDMILAGVQPNALTITSFASACASLRAFNRGLQVHGLAIKPGCVVDLLVGNSLIDMYSKWGDLEAARRVFDIMPEKDVYTWNLMIFGCCQAGFSQKMQKSGLQPDVITWNTMISGHLQNGNEDRARKMGKSNRILHRGTHSFSGYLQIGQKERAFGVFRLMQSLGVSPDPVTILSLLSACANLISLRKVKEIHGYLLRRKLDSRLPITIALIDSYAKSGQIEYSRTIFSGASSKDVITWNSRISGYVIHGFPDLALDTFNHMRNMGLIHGDLELVINARERLLELEPWKARIHQSILQAYGLGETPDDAKDEEYKKDNKALKPTGQSWIEVKNIVHSFVSGDRSKSCSDLLFAWVESISREVKQHNLHGGFCIHENEEEEKEETVGVHSEKLALAFAFVSSPSIPQTVRIMKNLRMCGDCHVMAKFLSKKYGCHIYLNDSECFHHFKHGQCSCGDY
ncbi:hypothetical protein Tsubulata_020835, partial [Turnera subulata]